MTEKTVIITCPSCGTQNRVEKDKMKGARCGKCKTPLVSGQKKVKTLTDENFDTIIQNSPVPVIVDCWAPWCGPCRMLAPVIDEIAQKYGDQVIVGKLNVDENPAVSEEFGIMSIPTLLFFKNGKLVNTIVGAVQKERIEEKLDSLIDPFN